MGNFIYLLYLRTDMLRYNPFNPQQPARPDFFVGREPEITEFEKMLSQTMHGSPMNMSITGNRGMGKTSILVKFEDLARNEGCLTLRLLNYEGNVTNIIDFSDYLSSNLKREILSRRPLERGMSGLQDWVATLKPTFSWNEAALSLEKQQVIQELLRQRLIKLWNEMKDEYKAAVILIDEAESLESIQGILPFLREVFQRLAADANYMVVIAGKLNFPERMSESFSPLNRFFPCSKLMPFGDNEARTYAIKRLATVNVGIDEAALNYIAQRSEGHPYVLVAMGYLLFDSLRDEETHITKEVALRAEEKINARLAQDFFAPMYHPLTPRAQEILQRIASKSKTLEFSFKDAVDWLDMPRNYVSPYIKELLRKGVLNKPRRGSYQIFHTLFLEYVLHLAKREKSPAT